MFLIKTSENGYSYTQNTASVTQTRKSQEENHYLLITHKLSVPDSIHHAKWPNGYLSFHAIFQYKTFSMGQP